MAKYKISFDRDGCIGALACAGISPEYWEVADDGKVNLKGSVLNEQTNRYELIVDNEDFDINLDAAEACPVNVIQVEEI